eukprot:COSAG05_NODE_20210_length_281_cov_1.384615_1_plen_68_part_10
MFLACLQQPLSAPKTWQTETNHIQLNQLRADVKRLLAAEGVVGAAFEELVIEVMGYSYYDWKPTANTI